MTRNQKIRWVMRKAWQLAKAAIPVHGGKVREYLGTAIRMAWAMLRQGFNIVPTFSVPVAVYHRDGEIAETAAASEVSFVLREAAAHTSFDDTSSVLISANSDAAGSVEAVEAATSAAPIRTGLLGKIANVARKAITAVKDFLTCAVHIELATPQME